ncbi:GNAT family N-acetyltransferase [Kytococcus sedentarius]|uniref:GNAT family N-acetyltransferase n=1 Tax=Kytococcus sedentarius TaxID=1276 RepID=UPI0035BC555D
MADDLTVRPIGADEWEQVRDLRLAALRDPDARIAFYTRYDEAAARTDQQWRENALAWSTDAPEPTGQQVVATTADGVWVASVVCMVQRAGEPEFGGGTIPVDRGQLLGVYVDPAHRGRGLLGRLTEAAADWARDQGLGVLSLWVHEDNARARAAYARLGFQPTGVRAVEAMGPELQMERSL